MTSLVTLQLCVRQVGCKHEQSIHLTGELLTVLEVVISQHNLVYESIWHCLFI